MNKLVDVKSPDPIKKILDIGFKFFIEHAKTILAIVSIVLALGGGWVGFQSWQESQEKKWQLAYYKIEKTYLKKKESFEKFETSSKQAEAQKKSPAPKTVAKKGAAEVTPVEVKVEGEKSTGDVDKDYGSIVQSLKDLIQQNPDSQAAMMSALLVSEIFGKYEKPQMALDTFQKLKFKSDFLSSLAQFRKAVLLSDLGHCDQAVDLFKGLAERKDQEFLKPESLLKSALCYENLQKTQTAQELYQRVIKEFANTSFSKEAQKFLRLVK